MKLVSLVWRKTALYVMIGFVCGHVDLRIIRLVPSFNPQRLPSAKFSSLEIFDRIRNTFFLSLTVTE